MPLKSAILGKIIIAGVSSGLCFVLPSFAVSNFFITSILSLFTPLPLYMVGLCYGYLFCLKASGIALLFILLDIPHFPSYIVYNAAPAVLLTFLAIRSKTGDNNKTWWYPEEKLLTSLVIWSAVVSLFSCFTNSSRAIMENISSQSFVSSGFQNPPLLRDEIYHTVTLITPLIDGIKGFTWSFFTAINVCIAQKVLLSRNIPMLRPELKLANIHLSTFNKLFFPLSLLSVLVLASQKVWGVAADALVLSFFPVLFNGLAVLGFVLAGKSRGLVFILGLLVFLFVGPILALALLGFVDGIWHIRYSLRKRLN